MENNSKSTLVSAFRWNHFKVVGPASNIRQSSLFDKQDFTLSDERFLLIHYVSIQSINKYFFIKIDIFFLAL